MTDQVQKNTAISLFILRLSLGIFMLVWALEKFVLPETAAKIFKKFYGYEASETVIFAVGAIFTILCLMVLAGAFKRVSYGMMLLLHSVTVAVTVNQIIDPWGLISGKPGHLFLAAVPVWAAMFALYLMRDQDTLKSWDSRNA